MKYLLSIASMLLVRVVLPLLILGGGVQGYLSLRDRPTVQAKPTEKPTAPLVQTVPVNAHDEGLDIQADGIVVPFREVELSAEVEGRITMKADICRAGNYVPAGTLLFQIDQRDYELEVRRLQKELAQADASLRELEVETENIDALVELAREERALQGKELARVINLAKQRVSTDAEIDSAKRGELAARNSLQTLGNRRRLQKTRRERLTSGRELAATQLEKAGLALKRTRITTPVAGVIIEDMVEQDSYVREGTSLIRINDSSTAEVRCSLKMEELYWVWDQAPAGKADSHSSAASTYEIPPTPVTVVYELLGRTFEWSGRLSRYEGTGLDHKTRTVPIRVLVSKPRNVRITGSGGKPASFTGPRSLVTGMFVTIRIHTRPKTRLLSVPEQAIRPGNRVWVVRDGKLHIQQIQLAETINGQVILPAKAANLTAGDRVIVSPLPVAMSGMTVEESAVGSK